MLPVQASPGKFFLCQLLMISVYSLPATSWLPTAVNSVPVDLPAKCHCCLHGGFTPLRSVVTVCYFGGL